MRILIVGGSGFLGTELVRLGAEAGHDVAATYLTRPGERPGIRWLPLDVRSRSEAADTFEAFGPETVINAAYRQADWASTADGAANIALAAAGTGAHLVHVSSDVVFSGAASRYCEGDPPDPVSPYGAAKAAAETAVRAVAPGAAIARTSLIIGYGRSTHESLVHALATGRRAGSLFTDDVKCPVHVTDLASALMEAAVRGLSGILHVAGSDALTRYELGLLIARRDGLDAARLPSGRRADAGLHAPYEVRLDCSATQRRLRTRLRGARDFLTSPAP
ncbi:SDR family oxidoreductase [Nonomuraea zeae]|uniref:Sugar nucleotide-binding protein n=1 Tax=Nonomuraea zeae TaxID=1642303 RepID=A0A5S4EZ15_9ACTN|nr:sugar nucleotide-binding protein [Nonomuraea zeae]TMR08746.1 sugar nucleotide-binding protein [Nonomuraea zeae]